MQNIKELIVTYPASAGTQGNCLRGEPGFNTPVYREVTEQGMDALRFLNTCSPFDSYQVELKEGILRIEVSFNVQQQAPFPTELIRAYIAQNGVDWYDISYPPYRATVATS